MTEGISFQGRPTTAGAGIPGLAATTEREAEFVALHRDFRGNVWAAAYAPWLDCEAASDIVQEAFLRLWQQWQRGEVIHEPCRWLTRVARNLARDRAKAGRRREQTHENLTELPARDPQPWVQLEIQERFAAVRAALLLLSSSDRELLTLRYGLNQKAAVIAAALEIDTAAVHMRLKRARRRMTQLLESEPSGIS